MLNEDLVPSMRDGIYGWAYWEVMGHWVGWEVSFIAGAGSASSLFFISNQEVSNTACRKPKHGSEAEGSVGHELKPPKQGIHELE